MLVELFTSQGCSSCPPADATLTKLALRDDVVALSFHVDYWDNLGWKDPFASGAHTRRQRDYAKAFGNRSVYTPQMVFDGRLEGAVQSDGAAVDMLDRLGVRRPTAGPIRLTRNGETISIAMAALPPGGEIWAAAFQRDASTNVPRGENAGRRLANINIVRKFERLDPAANLIWPGVDPGHGVAVWCQDANLGTVRAVTAI